jgi:hypothetical protein
MSEPAPITVPSGTDEANRDRPLSPEISTNLDVGSRSRAASTHRNRSIPQLAECTSRAPAVAKLSRGSSTAAE